MLRALLQFRRQFANRFATKRDQRGRFRDPRFVSFMAENNRTTLGTDLHDAVLQGRKMVKSLLRVGLALGGAWILLESARALSVF